MAGDRRCRRTRPPHTCRGKAQPQVTRAGDDHTQTRPPRRHRAFTAVGVHRRHSSPPSPRRHHIPPLSTDQVPANAAGYSITYTARPVTQEFSQTGGVDTHAKVARVATNPVHAHWEAIERILRYSPGILDPRFTHAEVSSPQKGYPNPTAAWPWSGTPHRGARSPSTAAPPPHPQSGRPPLGAATHRSDVRRQGGVTLLQPRLKHLFGRYTAEMHGGKEASWPHKPRILHIAAAIATTHERCDHHAQAAQLPPSHHHTGDTAADALASPFSFHQG